MLSGILGASMLEMPGNILTRKSLARFNEVFPRGNLPRRTVGEFVICHVSLRKKSKGTHWVSLFIDKNTAA